MFSSGHSQFCTETNPVELSNSRQFCTTGNLLIGKCSEILSLAKNVRNCKSEEKLLMLTSGGHIFFNQMGGLLPLSMKFHTNESSMKNILYFAEVANIAVVHINMDTSKGKAINVHIKDRNIIHFKAFAEGLFYTNHNDPTMITNPNNDFLNAYYYLSMVKNMDFFTDSEIEGVQKVRKLQQHLYCPGTSTSKTCFRPRRPIFLHALLFECNSKLCITFRNQFSVCFHIKKCITQFSH